MFKSTGNFWDDQALAEQMFLSGEIEELPRWHILTSMYQFEITREFLVNFRKVTALEAHIQKKFRMKMFTARQKRDDKTEAKLGLKIYEAWRDFQPLDEIALSRFEADYFVNRVTICWMRIEEYQKIINLIEEYCAGPFFPVCSSRRPSRSQDIVNRLKRAKKMLLSQRDT